VGAKAKSAPGRPVTESSSSIPAKPEAPTSLEPPRNDAAAGGGRRVTVEFVDRASFLNVYHRDIASGGLFVNSAEPARLHEIVSVELRPPIATANPLRFEARVVHTVDAPVAGTGAPRGMGVQFLDPDRVRATLAPIVLELRR
jgi:hypothetical protein